MTKRFKVHFEGERYLLPQVLGLPETADACAVAVEVDKRLKDAGFSANFDINVQTVDDDVDKKRVRRRRR